MKSLWRALFGSLIAVGCGNGESGSAAGGGGDDGGAGGGGGADGFGGIVNLGEPEDAPASGSGSGAGGGTEACQTEASKIGVNATFERDLATSQYAVAMLGAGFVPAPDALAFEPLREALDDIAAPRFTAWLEGAGSATRLQVRRHDTLDATGLDELIVMVDLSPSNASVDPLRKAVLRSLAREVDALNADLSIVGFAAEPLNFGTVKGGEASSDGAVKSAEAFVNGIEFVSADGHNLTKALGLLTPPKLEQQTYVLVLTDGGFTPTVEGTDAVIGLRTNGFQRFSVAQLSNLAGFIAGDEPAPRTELRRAMLGALSDAGDGFALFLHDGDVDCSAGACIHASAVSEFSRWFGSSPAPIFEIDLPAGIAAQESSGLDAKATFVPSRGTFAGSLGLKLDCPEPNTLITVWSSDGAESVSVEAEPLDALPRGAVNERLKDVIAALRSQTDENPAGSACDALMAVPEPLPCDNLTDPVLCAYAANVEAFFENACVAACGVACPAP